MTGQTFRDLKVWQEAADLVIAVYGVTEMWPRSEIGGLAIELRQAAVKVPAKIANGHGCGDLREYVHQLSIAHTSLSEVTESLELIAQHSHASPELIEPLLDRAASVDRQLFALREALAIRLQAEPFSP